MKGMKGEGERIIIIQHLIGKYKCKVSDVHFERNGAVIVFQPPSGIFAGWTDELLKEAIQQREARDAEREAEIEMLKSLLIRDGQRYEGVIDHHTLIFVREALDTLADCGCAEEAIEALEPDCYTIDLTTWLASDCNRVQYLTEALQDLAPVDGFQALALAQLLEKQAVAQFVFQTSIEKLPIENRSHHYAYLMECPVS